MSLREAQEAGLREHNRLRALHQDTEPMELCSDLCNEAQVLKLCLMGMSYGSYSLKQRRNLNRSKYNYNLFQGMG